MFSGKCTRQGRSRGYTALSVSQLFVGRGYHSLVMSYTCHYVQKYARAVPQREAPHFRAG